MSETNPFRDRRRLVFPLDAIALWGGVPMVGRRLRLSVPWSLKTTLRKEGPLVFLIFSGWFVDTGRCWEHRTCVGFLSWYFGESNLCMFLSPFRS